MFESLVVERPGEFVAIDTTSLDVFAIDPFTFQWVGLDLTAAIDVCTRSILAFRSNARPAYRRSPVVGPVRRTCTHPHEADPCRHQATGRGAAAPATRLGAIPKHTQR